MPFTALIKRQLALLTIAPACDLVTVGKTRGIAFSSAGKRQSGYTKENSLGQHQSGYSLDAFRHRSFGSAATATSVLRPFKRPMIQPATQPVTIQTRQCNTSAQYKEDIEKLVQGNKAFREQMLKISPTFFEDLAIEQKPPFILFDCSDSRVAEQTIFNAAPGTMFTSASIANQFHEWDMNATSALCYAVEALKVRHVIVMGHYGCGGVAASMIPVNIPLEQPAQIAIQTWIQPIREIYENSTRPEIVAHRKKHEDVKLTKAPHIRDDAFRALVEENVKQSVNRIAQSFVMRDNYASLSDETASPQAPVLIHGWVYDLENGEVKDLNVTVGPPGPEVPKST